MPDLAHLLRDLTGGDDAFAEQAALSLPAHEQAALDALLTLSQSPQPNQRWWALRALAGFPQPPAGKALAAALADSEPDVRSCAALALTQRPEPAAIPALISMLHREDSLLSRLAGDALAAGGAPAVAALTQFLQQPEAAGQAEAARALALAGDKNSIPTLMNLLESESTLVQYWAGEGLAKLGVGMTFFKP
ncbi:MAG: HEAT repeat domain-containing protein [Anaerolineales bacterium]|nr:HEAT repeat domain-containing protein [Anaerolineales bacterium]